MILVITDKNKTRNDMNGEKVIGLLWEVKEGKKHPNKAYAELCVLFNVVGRSEQLPCPKCGNYGTIDNQDGTVSTCPCHY